MNYIVMMLKYRIFFSLLAIVTHFQVMLHNAEIAQKYHNESGYHKSNQRSDEEFLADLRVFRRTRIMPLIGCFLNFMPH